MMYFLLILFFGSLLGIIFMIGRKLIILQSGDILENHKMISEGQYLEEWKDVTIKNIKKYSYVGLVGTIRFYFRFSNFIKKSYQELKIRTMNKFGKRINESGDEKIEENKFLKMMSEYKHKIRKIKHQIKKEEEDLL